MLATALAALLAAAAPSRAQDAPSPALTRLVVSPEGGRGFLAAGASSEKAGAAAADWARREPEKARALAAAAATPEGRARLRTSLSAWAGGIAAGSEARQTEALLNVASAGGGGAAGASEAAEGKAESKEAAGAEAARARAGKLLADPFEGRAAPGGEAPSRAARAAPGEGKAPAGETLHGADFKPKTAVRSAAAPPPFVGAEPEVVPLTDAARLLIASKDGDVAEALGAVVTARGGDVGSRVTMDARLKARDEINQLVGGLQDPRTQPGVDTRLRDLDHVLNAMGGVQKESLRPDVQDGFVVGTAKTALRQVGGVMGTVGVIGYTTVKAIDQATGRDLIGPHLPEPQHFNDPAASKASLAEAWHNVQGVWMGVYDDETGARRAKPARAGKR